MFFGLKNEALFWAKINDEVDTYDVFTEFDVKKRNFLEIYPKSSFGFESWEKIVTLEVTEIKTRQNTSGKRAQTNCHI